MSEQKHTPEECEPSPLGLPMRPILIRNDEMELLGASTPGPWKTDEEEYSQYVFGPDGEMICEMRGWGYLTGNRRKLSEKEAMEIQAANCKLIARAPELLQQVAALTKENEKYKDAVYVFNEELTIEVNKVKALTEQVEKLKAENGSFVGLISTLESELSRLREEVNKLKEGQRHEDGDL